MWYRSLTPLFQTAPALRRWTYPTETDSTGILISTKFTISGKLFLLSSEQWTNLWLLGHTCSDVAFTAVGGKRNQGSFVCCARSRYDQSGVDCSNGSTDKSPQFGEDKADRGILPSAREKPSTAHPNMHHIVSPHVCHIFIIFKRVHEEFPCRNVVAYSYHSQGDPVYQLGSSRSRSRARNSSQHLQFSRKEI